VRFSAATTAERVLPQGLALRARPWLDRLDGILFARDERGEAGRMSLIAFAIRVLSAIIAFFSQVLMARWMGSFEYGIFAVVWVFSIIVGNLVCFGAHTAIIRLIPEYLARGRLAELRGALLVSRLFPVASSVVLGGIGFAAVRLFEAGMESYYVAPFLLAMVTLPMIALSDVLQGIARANSWAVAALSPTYIIRPVLILLLFDIAVSWGYPPTAETAMVAGIIATYGTTIVQWIGVTTFADRRVPPGPRAYRFGEWLSITGPIFFVESFIYLLTNADVLVVGAFLPPDQVAVYFATAKTLALVHFVYFSVKAGVAPRYAGYAHGGRRHELAAFARETASWTFWPSLLMAGIVLALGQPILALFGPGFDAGYPYLFVLVLGVLARASVGPAESLLTMSGHQKACAIVYAITLAIYLTLAVALIPRFGLWGAAVALAASTAFEASALAWTAWRRLGITMSVFLPAVVREEA